MPTSSEFTVLDIYRPAPGNYASTATISGITAPVVSTLGNADNKKVVVFGPGVYTIGYWEVPGQRIDGVKFTNINVDAWGNDAFASGQFNILKASDGGSISNLTFSGLKVGGKPVTNTNYSTHGRFQLLGNTSNVVFKP